MRPVASAQNMNASSASGLCARWIVRGLSTPTLGGPTRNLCRLRVECVEVLCVLTVLGTLARPLGRFVLEKVLVRAARARGVAPQIEGARSKHEPEQVRGNRPADRVGLSQG